MLTYGWGGWLRVLTHLSIRSTSRRICSSFACIIWQKASDVSSASGCMSAASSPRATLGEPEVLLTGWLVRFATPAYLLPKPISTKIPTKRHFFFFINLFFL